MLFRRIMFASDGSPASLKAAEAVARIAATNQETTVTVVVTLPKESVGESDSESSAIIRARAELALNATGAVFQRWGIPHDDRLVTGDCACAAVAQAAKEDMSDLIAMNCTEHALTLEGKASNNLTAEVMHRAHVPVLVIPVC